MLFPPLTLFCLSLFCFCLCVWSGEFLFRGLLWCVRVCVCVNPQPLGQRVLSGPRQSDECMCNQGNQWPGASTSPVHTHSTCTCVFESKRESVNMWTRKHTKACARWGYSMCTYSSDTTCAWFWKAQQDNTSLPHPNSPHALFVTLLPLITDLIVSPPRQVRAARIKVPLLFPLSLYFLSPSSSFLLIISALDGNDVWP